MVIILIHIHLISTVSILEFPNDISRCCFCSLLLLVFIVEHLSDYCIVILLPLQLDKCLSQHANVFIFTFIYTHTHTHIH
jgi:hypothetical protein